MISIIRSTEELTRRSTSSSCPHCRACLSPRTIARTPELSMNSSSERSSRTRASPSPSRRSRSSTVSATAMSSSPTSASRTIPSASRFSRISKDGPASAKSTDGVGVPAMEREDGAILATGGMGRNRRLRRLWSHRREAPLVPAIGGGATAAAGLPVERERRDVLRSSTSTVSTAPYAGPARRWRRAPTLPTRRAPRAGSRTLRDRATGRRLPGRQTESGRRQRAWRRS